MSVPGLDLVLVACLVGLVFAAVVVVVPTLLVLALGFCYAALAGVLQLGRTVVGRVRPGRSNR